MIRNLIHLIYRPRVYARLLTMSAMTFLLAWKGCGQGAELTGPASSARLSAIPSGTKTLGAATAKSASVIQFQDVAAAAGLRYRWKIAGTRPLTILQTIGNGCAFLDYNNDGCLDILLIGPSLALYKGDGHGHFTDVTRETGLDRLTGHFLGCAVGDYDNDGYEDIYISAYQGGILLHNNHGQGFTDVTAQAGLRLQPWGTSCTFTDLDGDGKLDLYICNYIRFKSGTQPQLCNYAGLQSACGPRFYEPEFGTLYHNLGNGKFVDVTRTWGAQKVTGKALGVAAAPFDSSGRSGLALTNDEMAGDLLQNSTGKAEPKSQTARLQNIGAASGTAYDGGGNVHGGMGVDWGDYDNDGKLDLVVATFQHEPKSLYHNNGNGVFTESSAAMGLAESTMPYVAFGIKFLDADNDGFLDLILANGHVQDNVDAIDRSTTYRQPIQVFQNAKGTEFLPVGTDASESANAVLRNRIVGRGLAVGDFDNDGKMDALVVDSEGAPILLHNVTSSVGHWLSCRLEGTQSNRDGIGAVVEVSAGGRKLLRHCATDGSYMSASDRRVHFGLGKSETATVTIRWPDGSVDTFKSVGADRVLTFREGSATPHP